ncbi:MAG: thymidylate synthase, partial [Candidatus Omnitrophica bacterium]|nr:thymidylate synthase [Candidatus Omnitrophota bacterium]
TFNGAYGYRWRTAWQGAKGEGTPFADQLERIIRHLSDNPESRRAVLQMWNVEDDLLKIDDSKDVCCNLSAMFSIRSELTGFLDGKTFLDMTVTNRSNDLIWGTLGANVVHFSFLQEYIAGRLGISMGKYYHFTNNLHVYKELWDENANKWVNPYVTPRTQHDPPLDYTDRHRGRVQLCLKDKWFDEELPTFVDSLLETTERSWHNPFLHCVAWPMKLAFNAHKRRNYNLALDCCQAIMADDWKQEATRWITQRKVAWESKGK